MTRERRKVDQVFSSIAKKTINFSDQKQIELDVPVTDISMADTNFEKILFI
jgi:hypothetical protein